MRLALCVLILVTGCSDPTLDRLSPTQKAMVYDSGKDNRIAWDADDPKLIPENPVYSSLSIRVGTPVTIINDNEGLDSSEYRKVHFRIDGAAPWNGKLSRVNIRPIK